MTIIRLAGALTLLVTAVFAATVADPLWLLVAVFLGFALRIALWHSLAKCFRSALPIVIFAGVLALMQWISQTPVSLLPLKAVALYLLSTLAFQVLPGTELMLAFRPGSGLYLSALFAFFVRHFAAIFAREAERVLQARALCISETYGRGSFRSLVAAVVALFSRAVNRAERFYAAQSLRGLAE